MSREAMIKKLTNEIKRLESMIEYRKIYNIRNLLIKPLIKTGIVLDYALPYLLAAIITAYYQTSSGNAPFIADEVYEKTRIETIDTSSKNHVEHYSYDIKYNDKSLEYTTGWVKNDNNLYQRTVTSYRLNDSIDLYNTEKVLSMTKEELDNALIVTNIKTIEKSQLNEEDYIYNEDAVIVINHILSDNESIKRRETFYENTLHTMLFIALSFILGNAMANVKRVLLKTYVRDKLRELEPLYSEISTQDIEEIKAILKLENQNLELLLQNIDSNNPSCRIRKA